MTRIFISRELSDDSPFHSIGENVEVIGQSLIKITPIPFSFKFEGEWIFFYSKNGVKYFHDGLSKTQRNDVLRHKIGVMGKGTAKIFENLFHKIPDLVHDGDYDTTVTSLTSNRENILFVKAYNSLSTIEKYVNEDQSQELIVYNNILDEEVSIPEADIYVFTSPLNAETYMKKVCCRFNTRIVAIGDTTNRKLMEYGYLLASIPDEPNEESIVSLLKKMI